MDDDDGGDDNDNDGDEDEEWMVNLCAGGTRQGSLHRFEAVSAIPTLNKKHEYKYYHLLSNRIFR